jgi:hypothetical protein
VQDTDPGFFLLMCGNRLQKIILQVSSYVCTQIASNSHRHAGPECIGYVIWDTNNEIAPWRYPYIVVVAGLVWSNNPESYAGASVAAGRASHAKGVKGDDPDKKGHPGPPGWGLGVGLTLTR